MYLANKFSEPMPWAGMRWIIQEATGWTLEYIDDMSDQDVLEFLAVKRGLNN